MVSADNLNLDVLELIFAYLSGNDLVSVALVSRSFRLGVIPRLYQNLTYRLNKAKLSKKVTPFSAVLRYPELAVHVRTIDIRKIPLLKDHRTEFIRDGAAVLAKTSNLTSFTLTEDILPSFLIQLQGKQRLQNLRIYANLTSAQAEQLIVLRGLKSLVLDYASWNILHVLPRWTATVSPTLTTLTLFMAQELNEQVLKSALANLPNLTGLHVVGCPHIDHSIVLSLATAHTPLLETLSFTTWESPCPIPTDLPPLTRLGHLSIDTHSALTPTSTPALWTAIFSLAASWSCPLQSIALKLTERLLIGDAFIDGILDAHGGTLRELWFFECGIALDSIRNIAQKCTELDRLGVTVPVRDIHAFGNALSYSGTLTTLLDMGEKHKHRGPQAHLTKHSVQLLMDLVPNLKTVVTDNRRWTAHDTSFGTKVQLERRKLGHSTHWFLPRI